MYARNRTKFSEALIAKHVRLLLAVAVGGLAGCADITNPESTMLGLGGDRVTLAGANQLLDWKSFEKVNLVYELDPNNIRRNISEQTNCNGLAETKNADPARVSVCEDGERRDLAEAFKAFYQYPPVPLSLEARRNQIQDRIMAASVQRCNVYKTYLRRHQSETDFWLGTLTTALGGAGALFTNSTAPRLFSGFAGIVSGVNAEYNQAYYSNLAAHVVLEGIDRRRERLAKAIIETRGSHGSITEYTVEAAVTDAITYHGACHIVAGLQEASDSIKEVSDPGLRQFAQTALLFHQAQGAMNNTLKEEERAAVLAGGRISRAVVFGAVPQRTELVGGGGGESVAVQAASGAAAVNTRMASFLDWLGKSTQAADASKTPQTSITGVLVASARAEDVKKAAGNLKTWASSQFASLQTCAVSEYEPKIAKAKAEFVTSDGSPASKASLDELQAAARSDILIPTNFVVTIVDKALTNAKARLSDPATADQAVGALAIPQDSKGSQMSVRPSDGRCK